jgi:hypothetical protein
MIMVKHRDDLPEEIIARLQRIQANVDTQTSLIGELLELSRIKSRPEKREVVNMFELLDHEPTTVITADETGFRHQHSVVHQGGKITSPGIFHFIPRRHFTHPRIPFKAK